MMPPAGFEHRAEHLATLRRISHELLDRRRDRSPPRRASHAGGVARPDSDDGALLRLVRRDYEKAVRVPTELRAEMTRAAARARPVWVKARAESDFQQFLPVLERNVELRQRYVSCFDNVDEPYDILLDDFEPQTTTAEVRGDVRRAQARADRADRRAEQRRRRRLLPARHVPGRQPGGARERSRLPVRLPAGHLAARPDRASVRVRRRRRRHPHHDALRPGIDEVAVLDDARVRARALRHQLPRQLERLPTGGPCSLGIHESQSRMWENLVGRSRPFWRSSIRARRRRSRSSCAASSSTSSSPGSTASARHSSASRPTR